MKKLLILIAATFMFHGAATADDKPIQISQLPQPALAFIAKHFAGQEVSYAMLDNDLLSKDYKVVFDNMTKVEFDSKGEWTDVECKEGAVPAAIVPANVKVFIAKHHKGQQIMKLDRDSRGYEATLGNGLEVRFDSKANFVRYDD